MITFQFLPKEKAAEILPSLFRILYTNMSGIAPSGETYEEDFRLWYGAVLPALTGKDRRQILQIFDGARCIGYFQYYLNDTTFMMEEIQFLPEAQGQGVFEQLYAFLAGIVPEEIPYVEAYAHKNNARSQGILTHLGLAVIGENKNGNSYHYRGDCRKMLDRYRKSPSS